MNTRSFVTAAVAVLLLAGLSTAEAAPVTNVLFTNGNMQTFVSAGPAGSLPTGWTAPNTGLTGSQGSINSPFTNAYADNSSSFRIANTNINGAAFVQSFSTTSQYQSILVNFDFMLPTLTPNLVDGAFGIQFDGDGAQASTTSGSVQYRIDKNGNFEIAAGPGGGASPTWFNIIALEANNWYNVQATFNVTAINTGSSNGAGTQSGAITKFGGVPTEWSNVALLNTSLGFSRLLVRDRSSSTTGDLYLDNFAIVPEPSSALPALGGVGSLLALRFRRRVA